MFIQGVCCIYKEWIFSGQWFQKEKVQTLHQQSLALQTKILELQKSPFVRTKQHEVLENLESMQVQTSKFLLGLRKRNSVYYAKLIMHLSTGSLICFLFFKITSFSSILWRCVFLWYSVMVFRSKMMKNWVQTSYRLSFLNFCLIFVFWLIVPKDVPSCIRKWDKQEKVRAFLLNSLTGRSAEFDTYQLYFKFFFIQWLRR